MARGNLEVLNPKRNSLGRFSPRAGGAGDKNNGARRHNRPRPYNFNGARATLCCGKAGSPKP